MNFLITLISFISFIVNASHLPANPEESQAVAMVAQDTHPMLKRAIAQAEMYMEYTQQTYNTFDEKTKHTPEAQHPGHEVRYQFLYQNYRDSLDIVMNLLSIANQRDSALAHDLAYKLLTVLVSSHMETLKERYLFYHSLFDKHHIPDIRNSTCYIPSDDNISHYFGEYNQLAAKGTNDIVQNTHLIIKYLYNYCVDVQKMNSIDAQSMLYFVPTLRKKILQDKDTFELGHTDTFLYDGYLVASQKITIEQSERDQSSFQEEMSRKINLFVQVYRKCAKDERLHFPTEMRQAIQKQKKLMKKQQSTQMVQPKTPVQEAARSHEDQPVTSNAHKHKKKKKKKKKKSKQKSFAAPSSGELGEKDQEVVQKLAAASVTGEQAQETLTPEVPPTTFSSSATSTSTSSMAAARDDAHEKIATSIASDARLQETQDALAVSEEKKPSQKKKQKQFFIPKETEQKSQRLEPKEGEQREPILSKIPLTPVMRKLYDRFFAPEAPELGNYKALAQFSYSLGAEIKQPQGGGTHRAIKLKGADNKLHVLGTYDHHNFGKRTMHHIRDFFENECRFKPEIFVEK